jgi:hypothetical protein
MDGKELLYRLRFLLNEDSDSGFLDSKSSYGYLHEAATEFTRRTNCLKATQTITTVVDQSSYTLNADFLNLYLKTEENEFYIKYNDGSNDYFLTGRDYEDIIYGNDTTSVSIPSGFAMIDDPTLDDRITGTTTSDGAASSGESILTDTAADFTDASIGDIVHNVTDGSDGVILAKGAGLTTALFNGTNNDWTAGDSYIIQPQGRLQVVLDPPPSTAGHTITVHYTQRPKPVYSVYGTYRFQSQYMDALVKYAYFLYKYRDREPDYGNIMFQVFDRQVRQYGVSLNKSFNRNQLKVNFKKRGR